MTTPTPPPRAGSAGAYPSPADPAAGSYPSSASPTPGAYPPPPDPAAGAHLPPASPAAGAYSPATEDRVPYDVGEVSLGDLVGNVTRDLSTLMRQELALAQAELKQEAAKTAKGAGALGGAGLAGYFVVLFLSLALWAGLSNIMDAGWAALIVAALWAVIAAVLFAVGRAKLREVNPKPERTVDTLSTVPDALKGNRGGNP